MAVILLIAVIVWLALCLIGATKSAFKQQQELEKARSERDHYYKALYQIACSPDPNTRSQMIDHASAALCIQPSRKLNQSRMETAINLRRLLMSGDTIEEVAASTGLDPEYLKALNETF